MTTIKLRRLISPGQVSRSVRESDPELLDVYFNIETIFNTIITNLFTWSYQKTIIFYFD